MTDNDRTELKVTIEYDELEDVITVNFNQDERQIVVGFTLQEAQLFHITFGDQLNTALLKKLHLPVGTETKH